MLSSRSPGRAQTLSFVASFGCIALAIPAVLIGAAAKSAGMYHIIVKSSQPGISGVLFQVFS